MDKPIAVGDLVMVIKPSVCLGGNNNVGHIFRVMSVKPYEATSMRCIYCKRSHGGGWYAEDVDGNYPFRRLKRIDPDLTADDTAETRELERSQP